MDEITLDDKTYVSSKRAAAITGYAKDYVGQLCREGRVEARLVGRNWYILESSIREHRFGPEVKKEPVKTEDGAYEPANYAVEDISALPTVDSSKKSTFQMAEYMPEAPIAQESVPAEHVNTVQEMQNAWQDWFSISRKNVELSAQDEKDLLESPEIVNAREDAYDEAAVEAIAGDGQEETIEMHPLERVHLVRIAPEPAPEVFNQPEYKAPKSFNDIYQAPQEEAVPVYRASASSFTQSREPVIPLTPQPVIHQPRYVPQEPVYGSPRPEGRILHERRVYKKKKPSVALQAFFLTIAGIAIAVALIGSGLIDTFLTQNKLQYAPINFLGGEMVVNKLGK